jgi:hypothetical protein
MRDPRKETEQRIAERYGEDGVAAVRDVLGRSGVSDTVCRQYAVRKEFEERFAKEAKSVHGIQEDIADEFGLSRQAVSNIVLGQ